jgi:hypothetical protein
MQPNHDAALAGVFSALDALGRARSFGGFHYPSPESEAIAAAERAVTDAIHTIRGGRDTAEKKEE